MIVPGPVRLEEAGRTGTFACQLVGIGYVILSVTMSWYSLVLFRPYVESEYFWPHFRSSNISVVLTKAVNSQLIRGNNTSALWSPTAAIQPNSAITVNPVYARKLMFEELTSLQSAIEGLRSMDLSIVVAMVTVYCWADFSRQWELAYTTKRQARCWDKQATNGAVYFEAVLRNIDFNAWLDLGHELYLDKILRPIANSGLAGQDWLNNLYTLNGVNVADESKLWKLHGIKHFTLQYANRVQIGVEETLCIVNALGVSSSLTIQSIPMQLRGNSWTTSVLNGLIFNAITTGSTNGSLVRNTTNYFADDNPNQLSLAYIRIPMTRVEQALYEQLGPFFSIDLVWISPPIELLNIVNTYDALIRSLSSTNTSFQESFTSVSTVKMPTTPLKWNEPSLSFYGGNPMCKEGYPLRFVQQSFGFDDGCAIQEPLNFNFYSANTLFALLMLHGNTQGACRLVHSRQRESCYSLLHGAKQTYNLLPFQSFDTPRSLVELNISIMQFVASNASSAVSIDTQSLLDHAFSLFGWAAIYDWVTNLREVVSFQGDNLTLNLISTAYEPLLLPEQNDANSEIGYFLWCGATFVTITLTLFAFVSLLLWLQCRSASPKWLALNHAMRTIWLNQYFIMARCAIAMACLSTVNANRVTVDTFSYLHIAPKPAIESILFSGEVLWATYTFADIFRPFVGFHYLNVVSMSLSWLVIACIDIYSPITFGGFLERSCFTKNMDQMIYCSSGTLYIGQLPRAIFLVIVVQGSCMLLLTIIARMYYTRRRVYEPSLLLQCAAIIYSQDNLSDGNVCLDPVTAAIYGVFYSRKYKALLSVTHWQYLSTSTHGIKIGKRIVLPPAMQETRRYTKSPSFVSCGMTRLFAYQSKLQRTFVTFGFAYLIASIASNITFLGVVENFFVTDFGWTGFNATGAYSFLANLVNAQLLVSNNKTLVLESPSYGSWNQYYNSSVSTILSSRLAARRELFNPNVSLYSVIAGLRLMDPCMMPWMFTQYCWLDIERNWEMASTERRQARCLADKANGAKYLECPLRNIANWETWHSCWGESFMIGFSNHLESSTKGQAWLQDVQSNNNSISQEEALWHSYGVDHFNLEWQDYKSTGLVDSMIITTAFGFSYPLKLSSVQGRFHFPLQTTFRMYWSFAGDLWAVASNETIIAGRSLLRESPNFAFTNLSAQDLLYENYTLHSPLSAGLERLQSTLGPFGAIDMIYVSCPRSLLEVSSAFYTAVSELLLLSRETQKAVADLPTMAYITQIPQEFLDSNSTEVSGGNLLCGDDMTPMPSSNGISSYFGVNNMCHSQFGEYAWRSSLMLLFATIASQTTIDFKASDHSQLCELQLIPGDDCMYMYAQYASFTNRYPLHIDNSMTQASDDIKALNIRFVQYVLVGNTTLQLYNIPIFSKAERLFGFFAWCLIYEWTSGLREVVSFQGDRNSITTISTHASLDSMAASTHQIPQTIRFFCIWCVQGITWIFIVAGALVVFDILWSDWHNIEGLNLFELNRAVGHVYIGRLFLIIRGIIALGILNSSSLRLVQEGSVTHFVSPALEWYKTALAASEVLWLVYVFNGIGSIWTQQYTSFYAEKSTSLTWITAVVWTMLQPHQYSAKIERTCAMIDMDFELRCTSAYVEIGSLKRVGIAACLCLGCVVVCYAAERWYRPHLRLEETPSVLLDSSCLMFDFTNWTLDGEYFLDRTSAVMMGLIFCDIGQNRWVLDVKLWRLIRVPIGLMSDLKTKEHIRLYQAIPLSRMYR